MRKIKPPPVGGDPTAATELGPSAAAHEPESDPGASCSDSNVLAVYESNECGFHVTLTLIGQPDGGARRRWIESVLFGRYRLGTAQDDSEPELAAAA